MPTPSPSPDPPPAAVTDPTEDEELFGEEQVPTSPRERALELAVTILLALAALLSAWCAYQSSRFGGEQSDKNTKAAALRIESTKAESKASQLELVDASAFDQWVDATAAGNRALADFHRDRFRSEFRGAFDEWLALKPLRNPSAPKTPFTGGTYKLALQVKADALAADAERLTAEGERDGSTGDKYVLAVVLFAAALFLLGVQTRIGEFWFRFGLVAVAAVLVIGTSIWIMTLPRLVSL
jgi:hypothetical protein